MDAYSIRPGQGINREQMENALRLAEAKITLFEQRRATLLESGKRYRTLVRQSLMALAPKRGWDQDSPWQPIFGAHDPGFRRSMLDEWLEAHKAYDEAQANIYAIEIASVKAEAAIYQAALSDADDPAKKLALPGMM